MADVDTTPAQTTDDVGPSEVVETSVNDEAQDTDVDLEDIEITLDDSEEDDETNESEPEEEETAATEPETESTEESDTDGETEETPAEESDPEDKPLTEAEQKRLNDEYAKRRIAEKQLKEERENREREDLQRYLDEAQDDQEELARRELQVEKYNLDKERAQIATEKLEIGLDRAISEIDLFKTGTPAIKEELAASLDDFERMYVQRDKNGNVLSVNADIHQYLKTKAESIRRLTGEGARTEAKAKQLTKAKTDPLPTKTPKEAPKDTDLEDFDKIWG